MKLMKKLLMCLMAAALVCALATSALAASDTQEQNLLDILRQLYAEKAESSDTISFPALLASETDEDTETDESSSGSSSSGSDSEIPETNVEGTASITFGEPTIENGTGTIGVYVTADSGVSGVQMNIAYGSALTYQSVTINTEAGFNTAEVAADSNGGLLLVFADADNKTATDGLLLATLTFTVDTTATSGLGLTTSVGYVTNWTTVSDEDSTTAIGKYTTLEAGTATMLAFSLLDSTAENSAENPYLIDSVIMLELLRDNVNAGKTYAGAYFRQTADLDLNNEAWTPIGYNEAAASLSNVFEGSYDGYDHSIKNLYINLTEVGTGYTTLGLFGVVSDGTVKNLTVSGSITYTSTSETATTYIYVGGIAGDIMGATAVSSCTVTDMTLKIANETAYTAATSVQPEIGGIAGHAQDTASITGCSVESSVTVTGPNYTYSWGGSNPNNLPYSGAGGILGRGVCTISNCSFAGSVSGHVVGGIVAYGGTSKTDVAALSNCENTGRVTGSSNSGAVGGIAGYINYGSISSCINRGDVAGPSSSYECIAGLAAVVRKVDIADSVNVASVTANGDMEDTCYVGGLVGWSTGSNSTGLTAFTDSYNIGCVTGGGINGGILAYSNGSSSSTTITNCYNAGQITSADGTEVGAICSNTKVKASNVYYLSSACSEDTTGSTAVTWADMATLAERLGDSWVSVTGTNTVTFSFNGSYVSVTANGAEVEDAAVTVAVCPALSWETDTSANPAGVVFTLSASDNYGISAVTADGETLEADSDGVYALTVSENIKVTISVKRVSWGSDEASDSDIQSIIVSVAAATEEKSDENSTYDETLDLNGDDKNDLLDILSILYIRQAEDAAASDDSSSDDTSSDTDTTTEETEGTEETEETEETTETTETTVEAAAVTDTAAAEAAETEETAEAA